MPTPAVPLAATLGALPGVAMAVAARPVELTAGGVLALAGLLIVLAGAVGYLLAMRRGGLRSPPEAARELPARPAAAEPPPPARLAPAALPVPALDLIEMPLWVLAPAGEHWVFEHANAAACALGTPETGAPARPPLEAVAGGLPLVWPPTGPDADAAPGGRAGALSWRRVDTPAGPRLWVVRGRDDEADHFSFTISHDLRAPVRVVDGFVRIVKEDYGAQLDRVANDHLDRVLGAAARMNGMIDAILKLARLASQPVQRQPVNLSQLAGWAIDDLRRQHPERVVEVSIAEGLTTQGDPTLLRMALENLLGNAWKYSARTSAARIEFCRTQHHGRDAYRVRDNGAGFDMRSAERLFGLFQRLHSAGEFAGHGVGLASVRRIVQRHGGQVWAESEPGQGASFYFTLAD